MVAFLLAFLFRTFEAEAFVIPTGSMAPSLQGAHKNAMCPQCGYRYRTSASKEDSDQEFILFGQRKKSNENVTDRTCPQCRFRANDGLEHQTYSGDRIMVTKFPYEFGDVQRWDVVVFKYPGKAAINYIKRCVGLPGEFLRIERGDIYTKAADSNLWTIARKPANKLLAMLQNVHDNAYHARLLDDSKWPRRWQVDAAEGWTVESDGQVFQAKPSETPSWLRYRHVIPSTQQWQNIVAAGAKAVEASPPKAQLITDYYEYNDYRARGSVNNPLYEISSIAKHWVGDLALELEVEAKSTQGSIVLQLVEGGVRFQCTIDLAKGTVLLSGLDQSGKPIESLRAEGKLKLATNSPARLLFSNVDDRLNLWAWTGASSYFPGQSEVKFSGETTYDGEALGTRKPYSTSENKGDLQPVAVAVQGGASAVFRKLRVLRDVYYIHNSVNAGGLPVLVDSYSPRGKFLSERDAEAIFSDPARWSEFNEMPAREFEIPKDNFLMLGDNSPASSDGRLWQSQGVSSFVDRELIIGEALLIYFPHSDFRRFGLIR